MVCFLARLQLGQAVNPSQYSWMHREWEHVFLIVYVMNRRLGFRGRCQTDSGVIVRLRKNPRLRKRGTARVVTLLLNDNDLDLQGDIRSKLPSVRIRRYTASRSIKDRRIDLQRINEGRYVRPRPFWERYEDLKNRNRMSFRNVAKAVK